MTNSAAIYFPSDQIESQYIKSIWRLQDADTTPKTEIILPKGTIEIIFNLSNNITYFNPSLHIEKILPVCFINGINFKPFQLIKCGQQEFLGRDFKGTEWLYYWRRTYLQIFGQFNPTVVWKYLFWNTGSNHQTLVTPENSKFTYKKSYRLCQSFIPKY